MANVLQPMIDPFRKLTPKLSAVPYDYGTTGIAYNTKVISPDEAKEKGAALLLDKKYAGKVGGYSDMLDPATAIAVAEGQSYPPSLDPTKVKLTEKIEKLPAFDKTGTMKSLTFADPVYWATNEDAWTKQWNRISKGA